MSSRSRMFLLSLLTPLFLLLVNGVGCQSQSVATKPFPPEALQAQIQIENVPTSLKPNSTAEIKVRVKNLGNVIWPAKGLPDGKYWITLSYYLLDKDGKAIIAEGSRTILPHDVNPGDVVTLKASLVTPSMSGDYVIEFDMLQENFAWFKSLGSKSAKIIIKII